jgi:hypothetical protein
MALLLRPFCTVIEAGSQNRQAVIGTTDACRRRRHLPGILKGAGALFLLVGLRPVGSQGVSVVGGALFSRIEKTHTLY